MNDNFDSARLVTEHLLSRDTQPAYLGSIHGKQNVAIHLREDGYIETMKAHGKEPILVPLTESRKNHEDNENFGYNNMLAWLKTGAKPSSIFCATDTIALGAMKAIYDCNMEPGKDILIAGHDDLSFSPYTRPALTTVRQPKIEIGYAAVDIIINMNENGYTSNQYVQKIFSSTLIVRESA
jgi:DNA-binding LacI/PurR family transcriptional regulator